VKPSTYEIEGGAKIGRGYKNILIQVEKEKTVKDVGGIQQEGGHWRETIKLETGFKTSQRETSGGTMLNLTDTWVGFAGEESGGKDNRNSQKSAR